MCSSASSSSSSSILGGGSVSGESARNKGMEKVVFGRRIFLSGRNARREKLSRAYGNNSYGVWIDRANFLHFLALSCTSYLLRLLICIARNVTNQKETKY